MGNCVLFWSCSKAVYKHVWHRPLLSVQWINSWWWTDELSETFRVSSQNIFVKLVQLVGFIMKKSMEQIFFCEYMYSSHFFGKEMPDLCGSRSSNTVGIRNGGRWLKDISVSSQAGVRRKIRDYLYRYKWRPAKKGNWNNSLKQLQNVITPDCSTAFWASVLNCVLWNSEFFNKDFFYWATFLNCHLQ